MRSHIFKMALKDIPTIPNDCYSFIQNSFSDYLLNDRRNSWQWIESGAQTQSLPSWKVHFVEKSVALCMDTFYCDRRDHRFWGTMCNRLMTSLRSLVLYFQSLRDWECLPSKGTWPHEAEKIPEQIQADDGKVGEELLLHSSLLNASLLFQQNSTIHYSITTIYTCVYWCRLILSLRMERCSFFQANLNPYFLSKINFSIKPQYTHAIVIYYVCTNIFSIRLIERPNS